MIILKSNLLRIKTITKKNCIKHGEIFQIFFFRFPKIEHFHFAIQKISLRTILLNSMFYVNFQKVIIPKITNRFNLHLFYTCITTEHQHQDNIIKAVHKSSSLLSK